MAKKSECVEHRSVRFKLIADLRQKLKKKMFVRIIPFIVLVIMLVACFRNQTDINWIIISNGQGEWNIDELRITYVQEGMVTKDTTLYNHGSIIFSGTQEDSEYQFEKAIPLRNYELGPLAGSVSVLRTDLHFDLPTNSSFLQFIAAQIIKIEKKEIILFCPHSVNTIFDVEEVFDFYFKLSQK